MAAIVRRTARILGILLLAAVFCTAPCATAENKPLPPDCVGYIYTPSLATLIQNANSFVGLVMPGMNAHYLVLQLGTQLKNPALLGVDQARPQGMLFLNPKTFAQGHAFVLSVTDGAQFLAGTAQLAQDAGETEGVHTLSVREFDNVAFQRATPEQRQDIQQFMVNRNFYLALCEHASVGKCAVFSANLQGCRTVKGWLTDGLLDLPKSTTVNGDIVACVNVNALMNIYGPEIDDRLSPFVRTLEATVRAAQAASSPTGNMGAAAVAKILKMEIDAAVSLAKQMDTLSFGLDLRPEGLRLRANTVFKPGTPAASFAAAQKPFAPDLLRFLPPETPVLFEYGLAMTPEMQEFLISFIEGICDASEKPLDPVQKERAMALTREGMRLCPTSGAMGILAAPSGERGITLVSVAKGPDVARLKELIKEYFNPEGPFTAVYQNLGQPVTFKLADGAEVFEGVAVSVVEMDIAQAIPEAAEIVKNLYGSPVKMAYGVCGDKFLASFGKNAQERLRQVITLAKKGGPNALDSPNVKILAGSFPQTMNAFLAVVPGPLVSSLASVAPGAADPAMAPPAPIITGALGAYAATGERAISGELFVPMELVLSLKDAILSGGLGMIAGPRAPRPAPAGAPKAPPAQPQPAPAPNAPAQP